MAALFKEHRGAYRGTFAQRRSIARTEATGKWTKPRRCHRRMALRCLIRPVHCLRSFEWHDFKILFLILPPMFGGRHHGQAAQDLRHSHGGGLQTRAAVPWLESLNTRDTTTPTPSLVFFPSFPLPCFISFFYYFYYFFDFYFLIYFFLIYFVFIFIILIFVDLYFLV